MSRRSATAISTTNPASRCRSRRSANAGISMSACCGTRDGISSMSPIRPRRAWSARSRTGQHGDRPDGDRRWQDDHGAGQNLAGMGRRARQAVRRGRPDLGPQGPAQSSKTRPVQDRLTRHPSQRLSGRQVHAPLGDHAGIQGQHLRHRRYQRSRASGGSRAMVGAGPEGRRVSRCTCRHDATRSRLHRRQYGLPALWRRRHDRPRHFRRGASEKDRPAPDEPAALRLQYPKRAHGHPCTRGREASPSSIPRPFRRIARSRCRMRRSSTFRIRQNRG